VSLRATYRRIREWYADACKHGVRGAGSNSAVCQLCTAALAAAEQEAEELTARRERELAAKRASAYSDWLSRIRLPEYLRSIDPQQFELLICEMFRRMGYEARATPYSQDGEIDGYLRKNGRLSLLQCKRVKGAVGEPVLRDIYGTLVAHKAAQAIVVTTGTVSEQARQWMKGKPIRIIELKELETLISQQFRDEEVVPKSFVPNVGLVDACPRCRYPLRRIRGRHGDFFGCTAYPACRYTRSTRKPRKIGSPSRLQPSTPTP
jgi:Restriction endonuclease/Topoisomerase DNA binding C4 zinc finger